MTGALGGSAPAVEKRERVTTHEVPPAAYVAGRPSNLELTGVLRDDV